MVHLDTLVKTIKFVKNNWKIAIPSIAAFLLTLIFGLIFIYINNLFPILLRDPSGLFVTGGISTIAKKISSVLITQSELLKISLSFIGFIFANFLAGSSLIATKYYMIDSASKSNNVGLKEGFLGGSRFYWRVIEMRIMVFILIVVLSLVISLPLYFLSSVLDKTILVIVSVIIVLLLMRLILLYRYPVLFRNNIKPIPALNNAMALFRSRTKYSAYVWLISLGILFISTLGFEFLRISISDIFYGVSSFSVILISLYFIEELFMALIGTIIDVYVYLSYLKVQN